MRKLLLLNHKLSQNVKLPPAYAGRLAGKETVFYCAPSCLPVGRDPAYPAWRDGALAGQGILLKEEDG